MKTPETNPDWRHGLMQMISRLHKAAIALLPQQDSHSLSLTFVAFKKLQSRPIQLVDALSTLSDERILAFEPLHIANLLFALASLHFSPDPQFLRNMVTTAELQADLFKTEEWANLTWALAEFSMAKAPSLRCGSFCTSIITGTPSRPTCNSRASVTIRTPTSFLGCERES